MYYCNLEEHIHIEDCFDADGNLTCTLPAHLHSEECAVLPTPAPTETPEPTDTPEPTATPEPASTEETYLCGLGEHTHGEACYDEEGNLICELPEHVHSEDCLTAAEEPAESDDPEYTCGLEEHTHGEACYDEEGNLICELPEHTHTEDEMLAPVRMLTAAIYTDGTCQVLSEDAAVITITGELPEGAEAVAFPVTVETEMEVLCAYDISVRLPDGSLFAPSEDKPVTITIQSPGLSGIGEDVKSEVYLVPEQGPLERMESERFDSGICFEAASLRVYMVAAVPVAVDGEQPETVALSNDFCYENELFSFALHVEGSARVQDGTSEATSAPAEDADSISEVGSATELGLNMAMESDVALPESATEMTAAEETPATEDAPVLVEATGDEAATLVVTELDDQQTEYQEIASSLEEGYADGLLELSVLSMEFYYQDRLLDVSSCNITAQVTPQSKMMETAQAACASLEADAVPEAETGVVFAVVEPTSDGAEELDSAVVDMSTQEAPVLMASVGSDGVLAVAAAQTANPEFTVQYYAWLNVAADAGDGANTLTVIDTTGGKLPQNGSTPTTKTLYLEAVGSGTYGIKTTRTLTPVYSSQKYEYITAPNLSYFNRLYENGNYAIDEVWILKKEKQAEIVDPEDESADNPAKSVNRDDWDVYDPKETHFTNRSQSVNANTVLITEGTVIRLVFNTTKDIYTNAVNFYDYDITDDGVHTAAQGINSASNYTGSGVHLAFGNVNTDTGLGTLTWNGNELNKYNRNGNGYQGCTFGLAARLSGGNIQYASGVSAPNLFGEGGAIGRTSYDSGQYTLSFDRKGDTYTLASVGGTNTSGLQTFNHPTCGSTTYNHIWTNNFWPMDVVKNKDPHTGQDGNVGTYIGASNTPKNYPLSDDGLAHNSMFGMTYKVNFTLTEDYIGPLEYYFFGDDDMWVFLDGQLVCDIGGVHSSVGEYVNLWDYIKPGSAGTYTLTFFYTERGLSGSTCYMQFTLPSVSSTQPPQTTELLKVEKTVEGPADSDEEFHFEIKFTDQNGRPLPDDYSYTRYTAENKVVKRDVIIFDGGSFDLKAGEYVIINYLPHGTRYTITETNVPHYTVQYQVDDGSWNDGNEAKGLIPGTTNGKVVFKNTARYELPQTGGSGTIWYTAGGTALLVLALLMYKKRRQRGCN